MFGLLLAATLFAIAGQVDAQGLNVDIVNGTKSAIPITVVPFASDNSANPPSTKVGDVIRLDLARSGKFRTLDKKDIVEYPSRGDQIKFATWHMLKQDYIVVGHVDDAGDGAYKVSFELWNVNKQQSLLNLSYNAKPGDLRGVAHQIADKIFETITGIPGAFWTRIAYVTAVGTGKNITYSLIVADSDGYNPQVVVRSKEALLSPTWSPDGSKLAYVSFENGNSAIYIQDIATGSRQLISGRAKGINGAPAFSPDGTKLAVSLSYVGNPEIFIINLADHHETRLTHNFSIDTEPTWTPDGKNIVFTSDRSGKPQLYQMPATGGTPSRITFQGNYNANASIGPDGKKIAMVQGSGNVYRIAIMDRSLGDQEHFVSPGNFDDAPSFAPNGCMLLYAASQGTRGVLYEVSEDGKVRQRLVLSNGDVREPAWGPYRHH
ncbi:Tol-Pal system beta propeller repeat protein TolB [Oleiagrimonas sp. C23AA]|uniref:Tol-Pal system beta propeller repeat protein TolB n=1 Tax=Oleiagrimonas sp. C23AA TaxID=2719047 RepID=UPI001F1036A5|nr:Tol-Pal system beta propeller repeat protein TolB [Oleiagrimonas sp. C23AA]